MYTQLMKLKKVILLFILLYSYSFCQNLDKVQLQLDWLHQFQFAGYYIAKEKGFYKQNGLDVNIKEFTYQTDLIDETLNNEGTYAIGKSSLIIERLKGKKITLLSAIYQNSPMVLITRKDTGINEIEDLINKKVMLTSDAKDTANIISMIKSQGVKSNKINLYHTHLN